MMTDGKLPPSLTAHKRLRGGRMNDREKACPGNDEDWAILENIYLGVATQTEVFELQLRDVEGKPLDRTTAYTLAIAFRRALCFNWLLVLTDMDICTERHFQKPKY